MVFSPTEVGLMQTNWKFNTYTLSIHRWSFGGNRLQIKAETRLLADVESALQPVWQLGLKVEGNFQSLAPKQELLCTLLENEQMRLAVWLHPLDYDKKHVFSLPYSNKAPHEVSGTRTRNRGKALTAGIRSALFHSLRQRGTSIPVLLYKL